MNKTEGKIYIGFITYGNSTAKYLPYFLPSLFKQTYSNFELIVSDNSDDQENANTDYLKKNNSNIEVRWSGANIGYAKAYNQMIEKAKKNGAEYFLALNPDMVLDENFLDEILKTAHDKKEAGAIVPRIYNWDFKNKKKTDIIDSCGLCMNSSHRFFEYNQGQKCDDCGESTEEVFGFTGAAVLFDVKALDDVVYVNKNGQNEYFDELMFMYKEDCDLSYRLRLAGWKIFSSPSAKVYHDRTATTQGNTLKKIVLNRKNKNRQIKRWSFLNHWIIILKYRKLELPINVKIATYWYQLKSLIYVTVFEPYLLCEIKKLWKLRKEIDDRCKSLKIRISTKEINYLFK